MKKIVALEHFVNSMRFSYKAMVQPKTGSKKTKIESNSFNEEERIRFHNLLKLASESTFEGERAAALAAAKRLAKKNGMTLDEAASGNPLPKSNEDNLDANKGYVREKRKAQDLARHVHMMDNWVQSDKARRDAALAEAYERGLDNHGKKRNNNQTARRKASKRNPKSHATVLLKETNMPIDEIASLTGLDIYEVVGLKLKMRKSDE